MSTSIEIGDLEPLEKSGIAWRWKNAPQPTDGVSALRPPSARDIFKAAIELDNWARARPDHVLNVRELAANSVTAALLEWVAPSIPAILLSWSEDEALWMPWGTFATRWGDLCYPSSDDATVFPQDRAWALSFSHTGRFYLRRR